MAMLKPEQLRLRCYAELDHDGTWFVMCIDLNLYARADSYHDARKKLHAIIVEYIQEALTVDSQHIADLVPRRAPVSFVLRYYWIKFLHQCWKAARDVKRKLFFEALPVAVCT